ncbi:cytoplasmic phosphatidylinositol transfer protein 1 [Eurytemora carolleeae]|uniref:cytoplasmic phosphatidylinositol transfer protein 1 n=1 Tax=Eurytemora carolleeae TaxID=1294199 RepID=UPI000C767FB4|nr:cytoplasmic phosphatidylinositol transfer protein 1 [Eurytemora carolleeae]|eukprot:XP_023332650.1 cytoplasmic phosphatidylinositol transfer protein 1-like [Eurytemora affinis]
MYMYIYRRVIVSDYRMLVKEYRICMPLTVEEYKIGQLYMIAKHSHEQSQKGEGVEVVENRPHEDPEHGKGQYTEKRIHLSSKLPSWIRSMVPKIFYVTEKAWNYYPFTITEYSCSFLPRFHVHILTKYENNNGSTENCLNCSEESLKGRTIDHIDISLDECSAHHYKVEEDVKIFKSVKTGRGPLEEGWREDSKPIMCSYKLVEVKFDMMYLLQSKIEEFVHRVRDEY